MTQKPLKREYKFFIWGYVHQVELSIVVEFGLFSCTVLGFTAQKYIIRIASLLLILHLVFPVLLELMVDCTNTFLPSCWCLKDILQNQQNVKVVYQGHNHAHQKRKLVDPERDVTPKAIMSTTVERASESNKR